MAYGALACGGADAAAPADRAVVARAQRQWTVEQGLPSNSLTALAEDADGLVWIATLAGLVRFDGVTFVVHDAASVVAPVRPVRPAIRAPRRATAWAA